MYLHHIIYTLNLWESPKSAECDAGYELFLAVFQRRFYFTALPVACARVKLEWVKKEKKKMRPRWEYGWCESVYRFIARFISLSCIPTPSWSPALPVETRAGVRTLIGKPGVVSSTRLGKSARLPSALCFLPSAGFLLTPPLKQIKAPSPSRAHLRGSR